MSEQIKRIHATIHGRVQGEEGIVKQLLKWLPQGSPMSQVSRVESRETDPVSGESEFEIRW